MTTAALPKQKAPVTRISAESVPAQAFADLLNGARLYELWSRFAFHDIRQRFRRSVLGPFWLTLSMGILVATLGLVFSALFQQDVAKTLPYIATGIIFWGLSRAASTKAPRFSSRQNPRSATSLCRSACIFTG